jgi:hypothetical protein
VTLPDAGIDQVRDAVIRLRDDPRWRVEIAANSKGGDHDFDPRRIRDQFIDVLRHAASRGAVAKSA